MLRPGGEHQQQLRRRVERFIVHRQQQASKLLAKLAAAGFTGYQQFNAVGLQGLFEKSDAGGFTDALASLNGNKQTARTHWPGSGLDR